MAERAPATVAVVDYGIGNLRSAQKAFERVGASVVLSSDTDRLNSADALVLPGVGAFGPTMRALRESGLDGTIGRFIDSGRPFLGICVGMQVLFEGSEEAPETTGLGVFPGTIRRLPEGHRVPQMQWNKIQFPNRTELFAGLGDEPWLYFVHSYAAGVSADTVAVCEYGRPFAAAVQRENVYATQFHPEKSGANGLRLITNFVSLEERGK